MLLPFSSKKGHSGSEDEFEGGGDICQDLLWNGECDR